MGFFKKILYVKIIGINCHLTSVSRRELRHFGKRKALGKTKLFTRRHLG